MNELLFDKVVPTKNQIHILYDLLCKRKHNISHKINPNMDQHILFVNSNPYREWQIIANSLRPIGSFYLTFDNLIGINLVESYNFEDIDVIIKFIKKNFSPLPAKKSVRSSNFAINVSPSNTLLLEFLIKLKLELVQHTYLIK